MFADVTESIEPILANVDMYIVEGVVRMEKITREFRRRRWWERWDLGQRQCARSDGAFYSTPVSSICWLIGGLITTSGCLLLVAGVDR